MNKIKKMHLSKTDKKIGGVCGGIGETFEIDSTIIRLIFIFLALVTEIIPAIIIYILAWLIIPSKI
ncbi:MAG: Phage shock protein C, PspC [Candidatus Campbellbacteria bacterium GW2011_GWD1_35_49]|nr:MAG: phage shock protein C, PspC, phage shock protein C [Candidatus Campbellbacteria bacterium GW2011_OD1_34_28]KKP74942.1 MAG: Phage shock protein C, PspC [Candidatus Campbellbacteria bacterium GW2011_GWD2_35_24]KKP75828.1 MAG: phage shock protein C, PspC, phage shock protein C [Candidatus Campbellbacteria bacterium GW2011_GWC2_35_28]KKP76924.1 MAG: Phage shock protein C, PspC [Candidatus Campbellbacteria bacterium GW2011_GWC1_35_31]KKP78850.1 MAG: Phage shock protein C, PspC [Candidatus Ca